MRRAALILAGLILAGVGLRAQTPEDYHFATDGEVVRWQMIYQAADSCRAAVILSNIKTDARVEDVVSEVDGVVSFVFRFRPAQVIEELGYSRPLMPAYITAGDYTARVTVQVKPDRYRVTAEGIRMILPGFGDTRLEVFALRRGAWAPRFTPAPADILDYYLGSTFSGLDILRLDDEW